MTQFLNFQKLEVSGSTKAEALENAPFGIMGDATQAYKLWRSKQTTVTDAGIKQFCIDYLAKKSKNMPGVGFSITLEAAVADTRERPYKIENVKSEGKRKMVSEYRWVDNATNETVCAVQTVKKEKNGVLGMYPATKADAEKAIKELYVSGSYKGNASLVKVKVDSEGDHILATAQYTPSKSSKPGRYLVFGIQA